jgi:hypothetical protein
MITKTFQRALLPLLLASACGAAQAGVLTFQGVTFTSTVSGKTLTLEIDAAHPAGDWAQATTIGALELKNIGRFDGVQLLQAPGAASSWTLSNNELTAKGCAGGRLADTTACYSGTHVALADDMIFRFAFDGNALDLDEPSLKVNFFIGDGKRKVGSILSQEIPAGEVQPPPTLISEPRSAAMLLGGLLVMGLVNRRRKAKCERTQANA